MIRHLLLFISTCLLSRFAVAQNVPAFMVGPTVGIDQVTYVNAAGYVGAPYYSSAKSTIYGVESSYQTHRILISLKLLYSSRTYQVSTSPVGFDWAYTSLQNDNADLHVLTVPLSISYRLVSAAGFQWFVGGNVATEYLLETSDRLYSTQNGITTSSKLEKNTLGKPINIGYGIQTTFRYLLTPRMGLQLEPALRRYSRGGFPTSIHSNFQFQGLFSVLFKV